MRINSSGPLLLICCGLLITQSCSTTSQRSPATNGAGSNVDSANSFGCNEVSEGLGADHSTEKQYFMRLLKQGMDAPIQNFLHLWYPERKSEDSAYFFHCENEAWGPLQADANEQLSNDCKPDELFSWGSEAKRDAMAEGMPDGGAWTGSPNPHSDSIYTALSPVSTYGYGPIQIRLKIKAGIPFDMSLFGHGNTPGEVFVHTMNGNYQEFILIDSSVIEGWSIGTPEQYDEIVKDMIRITSGKQALAYYTPPPKGHGMNRLIGTLADVPATESALKGSLLLLIETILNNKGKIHYSKGACRNRQLFFSTKNHTYFN